MKAEKWFLRKKENCPDSAKREGLRIFKMTLAAVAGILLCFALYDLVDRVWNGLFVDWFSKKYMMSRIEQDSEGLWHYVWQPAWPAVHEITAGGG